MVNPMAPDHLQSLITQIAQSAFQAGWTAAVQASKQIHDPIPVPANPSTAMVSVAPNHHTTVAPEPAVTASTVDTAVPTVVAPTTAVVAPAQTVTVPTTPTALTPTQTVLPAPIVVPAPAVTGNAIVKTESHVMVSEPAQPATVHPAMVQPATVHPAVAQPMNVHPAVGQPAVVKTAPLLTPAAKAEPELASSIIHPTALSQPLPPSQSISDKTVTNANANIAEQNRPLAAANVSSHPSVRHDQMGSRTPLGNSSTQSRSPIVQGKPGKPISTNSYRGASVSSSAYGPSKPYPLPPTENRAHAHNDRQMSPRVDRRTHSYSTAPPPSPSRSLRNDRQQPHYPTGPSSSHSQDYSQRTAYPTGNRDDPSQRVASRYPSRPHNDHANRNSISPRSAPANVSSVHLRPLPVLTKPLPSSNTADPPSTAGEGTWKRRSPDSGISNGTARDMARQSMEPSWLYGGHNQSASHQPAVSAHRPDAKKISPPSQAKPQMNGVSASAQASTRHPSDFRNQAVTNRGDRGVSQERTGRTPSKQVDNESGAVNRAKQNDTPSAAVGNRMPPPHNVLKPSQYPDRNASGNPVGNVTPSSTSRQVAPSSLASAGVKRKAVPGTTNTALAVSQPALKRSRVERTVDGAVNSSNGANSWADAVNSGSHQSGSAPMNVETRDDLAEEERKIQEYVVNYGLLIVERDSAARVTWMCCKLCPIFGCKTRSDNYIMAYGYPFLPVEFEYHLNRDHAQTWEMFRKLTTQQKGEYLKGRALPEACHFRNRVDILRNDSNYIRKRKDVLQKLLPNRTPPDYINNASARPSEAQKKPTPEQQQELRRLHMKNSVFVGLVKAREYPLRQSTRLSDLHDILQSRQINLQIIGLVMKGLLTLKYAIVQPDKTAERSDMDIESDGIEIVSVSDVSALEKTERVFSSSCSIEMSKSACLVLLYLIRGLQPTKVSRLTQALIPKCLPQDIFRNCNEICALSVQYLRNVMSNYKRNWPVVLTLQPCFELRRPAVRVLISHTDPLFSIQRYHVVSVLRQNNAGETLAKMLDVICPRWRDRMIGVRNFIADNADTDIKGIGKALLDYLHSTVAQHQKVPDGKECILVHNAAQIEFDLNTMKDIPIYPLGLQRVSEDVFQMMALAHCKGLQDCVVELQKGCNSADETVMKLVGEHEKLKLTPAVGLTDGAPRDVAAFRTAWKPLYYKLPHLFQLATGLRMLWDPADDTPSETGNGGRYWPAQANVNGATTGSVNGNAPDSPANNSDSGDVIDVESEYVFWAQNLSKLMVGKRHELASYGLV